MSMDLSSPHKLTDMQLASAISDIAREAQNSRQLHQKLMELVEELYDRFVIRPVREGVPRERANL